MRYLVVLFAILSTCCGSFQRPEARHNSAARLVRELSADTVALVVDDQDGDTVPFCSGVWVADDKILTAGHCAAAVVPDGEGDAGTPVQYIVQAEVVGQWQNPTTRHEARVLRIDRAHDLALLYAPNSPSHAVARLADADPRPGDELHFIGQDRGFYWTYMRGG